MREMKDSGIEWVGSVPRVWVKKKIKNAVSYIGSGTTPPSHDLLYYDGGIFWIQSGDIYGKNLIFDTSVTLTDTAVRAIPALRMYEHDFIVIAMYGGSVGNIAVSKIDACTNQACCVIKPDENNDMQFLYYWMLTCRDDFLKSAIGGGQPNISQAKIRNQYYFQPSLSEQHLIASFLDAKCAEIDALTADIQTQIDMLEQYKRSVITEAVTKGLNPDAEMKDSGIGWMPCVPEHWKVDKLKYHLKYCGDRNPGEKEVLSLYRELGVVPKDSRDDNHNVTSEDTTNYRFVRIGDFVVNKMKAWQGSVAVSDYEGIVSPAYFVYRFTDDIFDRKYFHYLLRNKTYTTEFMRLSGGIRVGQWDLPASALDNILVLIPPMDEQKAIANYLDAKCVEIDEIVKKKREQINTIDEYKKSLIFEYVTGKKEVIA